MTAAYSDISNTIELCSEERTELLDRSAVWSVRPVPTLDPAVFAEQETWVENGHLGEGYRTFIDRYFWFQTTGGDWYFYERTSPEAWARWYRIDGPFVCPYGSDQDLLLADGVPVRTQFLCAVRLADIRDRRPRGSVDEFVSTWDTRYHDVGYGCDVNPWVWSVLLSRVYQCSRCHMWRHYSWRFDDDGVCQRCLGRLFRWR